MGLKFYVLLLTKLKEEDMLNKNQTLEHYQAQLADVVQDHAADLPECRTPEHLAMVGNEPDAKGHPARDKTDWAQSAAATLLLISPQRLWRRLCVTAYEDVGYRGH